MLRSISQPSSANASRLGLSGISGCAGSCGELLIPPLPSRSCRSDPDANSRLSGIARSTHGERE